MTWDDIEGNWRSFRGKARERWARLTEHDLDQAGGKKERLEGALQLRYGQTRDEAQREMDDFCRRCSVVVS